MWFLATLLATAARRELVQGGRPIPASSAPFMVRLYSSLWGNGFCGGTLITLDTVLTAAHCVTSALRDGATIYAGTHQTLTSAVPDELYSDVVPVARIVSHPLYNHSVASATFDGYDVALLTLERAPSHAGALRTVALDDGYYWPADAFAPLNSSYVLGYGSDVIGGAQSLVLESARVALFTDAKCASLIGELSVTNRCAGSIDGSACSGDSGGPLVVAVNGSFVQVGIVSWGPAGECGDVPAVYVTVSDVLDFVAEHVAGARVAASVEPQDSCECTCSSNGFPVGSFCSCADHGENGLFYCYVAHADCADALPSSVFVGAYYRFCTRAPSAPPLPPRRPPLPPTLPPRRPPPFLPPLDECKRIKDEYIEQGCCPEHP